MTHAALPAVQVVRYRALEANLPSLRVAAHHGFEPYGANLRCRLALPATEERAAPPNG